MFELENDSLDFQYKKRMLKFNAIRNIYKKPKISFVGYTKSELKHERFAVLNSKRFIRENNKKKRDRFIKAERINKLFNIGQLDPENEILIQNELDRQEEIFSIDLHKKFNLGWCGWSGACKWCHCDFSWD